MCCRSVFYSIFGALFGVKGLKSINDGKCYVFIGSTKIPERKREKRVLRSRRNKPPSFSRLLHSFVDTRSKCKTVHFNLEHFILLRSYVTDGASRKKIQVRLCNPSESFAISTILVPFRFIITFLVFFYLIKLLV